MPTDGTQHREHGIAPRQRGVPVQTAERVRRAGSALGSGNDVHLVDDGEAAREVRHGAAGVREDVCRVRSTGECVAVVHLSDGTRGVGSEVDQGIRQPQRVSRGARGRVRMDEHHGLSTLQLVEHRRQPSVTEVDAEGVAEQHDAVEVQLVEAVAKLVERAIDIRQWKTAEATEAIRMVALQIGRQLVAAPRELAQPRRRQCGRPGVLMDVMAASISASSRKDNAAPVDQGGGWIPPTG